MFKVKITETRKGKTRIQWAGENMPIPGFGVCTSSSCDETDAKLCTTFDEAHRLGRQHKEANNEIEIIPVEDD